MISINPYAKGDGSGRGAIYPCSQVSLVFVFWFVFSIIHGSGRDAKTGKAWEHYIT